MSDLPDLDNLRLKRNRLLAPYVGFVFLFLSCGAMAGTGQAQASIGPLLGLLALCTLPVIVLNISLHRAIRLVKADAASSGLKQTLISSLLFTPVEAALVLPAINLAIASKILRRWRPPPDSSGR